MNSESAIAAMAALAQPTRLDAFELIAGAGEAGLAAGEIARLLGVRQNTMSAHLLILARAGIVMAERQSRSIVYKANQDALGSLIGFLSEYSGRMSVPVRAATA